MKVSDIVKERPLSTIAPDKTVQEAIRILNQHNIGALPVCDEKGELAGIITERDVLRLCDGGDVAKGLQQKVSAVMTKNPHRRRLSWQPDRRRHRNGTSWQSSRSRTAIWPRRLLHIVTPCWPAGRTSRSFSTLPTLSSNSDGARNQLSGIDRPSRWRQRSSMLGTILAWY